MQLEHEKRRAVIATIDGDHAEVLLLKSYGNSLESETLGDEEIPPIHVSRIQSCRDLVDLRTVGAIDDLRDIARNAFKLTDWRGASAAYSELLVRLQSTQSGDSHFLVRTGNAIHVAAARTDGWTDLGPIDPTSAAQWTPALRPKEYGDHLHRSSAYRILMPLDLHTTTLLNLGRSFLNSECLEGSAEHLTYAIFLSCLSGSNGRSLRSKAHFWRSKCRTKMGNPAAALRDAQTALALASEETVRDCEILVRTIKRSIEEQQRGTRLITRELMKICEEQIRNGTLDFSI